MGKDKLKAQLTKLIDEYKALTAASKRGDGIDLAKLDTLNKRKEALLKRIERFKRP